MKSVVIVGRPNVGKSTLFNKLVGKKKSIVHPKPGMTRDLITYSFGKWELTDSGGIDFGTELITEIIKRQVFFAIEEAELILFVVDGKEGITAIEEEIAKNLRNKGKEVFLVWNKIDSKEAEENFASAYSFGFEKIFKVSSEHNIGTGLLKEEIEKFLKIPFEEEKKGEVLTKISILGKPNVGKSSLLNALLGKEKVIVSPIPGTTRDSVDIILKYYGRKFIYIDTAGQRRKTKIKEEQDSISVLKAKKAMVASDIVLFLLDSSMPITNQDREIAKEIEENYKPFVFVANKGDLLDENKRKEFKENLYKQFPYFDYAPLIFVSALKRYNLDKIWKYVLKVEEGLKYRISTGILNRNFREILKKYPSQKRKFYFITQTSVAPPTFVIVSNTLEKLPDPFLKFLKSEIRKIYPFLGVPIKILLKRR